MLKHHEIEAFFAYANERESIRSKRERGMKAPWTDDPILQKYRFTNIFREDDAVTEWFRREIREPMADNPDVLFATIAFRWFNLPSVGEALVANNLLTDWCPVRAHQKLGEVGPPYVNGAYIIKTPDGMNKLDGVIWCINQAWWRICGLYEMINGASLQDAHDTLLPLSYMGPFMAYEVVTDLRHTHMLRHAPDIMTWANPGPGCARGLSWLCSSGEVQFNRTNKKDVAQMIELMQVLLTYSRDPSLWPARWASWEMREVEHTLCEYDKYRRTLEGKGKPKQIFRNGDN